MRKVANNFLYGQTSQLLAGRFDTEIFNAGCLKLQNFDVLTQGGIKRRPPKKKLIADIGKASRIINFTIDSSNSFLILLGGNTDTTGSSPNGSIAVYIASSNTYGLLSYISGGSDMSNGWSALTDTELKDVRSVVYYNDLLLVHKNVPLMRVHYNGGSTVASMFTITIPVLKMNQDSPAWGNSEITYGIDDYKEVNLNNSTGNYASVIGVIGERLYLGGTINKPFQMYASRIAESSQVVTPTVESDNLFDFMQFQVVETETTDINTAKIPVVADGEYIGSYYAQKMWKLPADADDITTLGIYNDYKLKYSLRVSMVTDTTKIDKIYKTTDGVESEYIYFTWNGSTPTAKLKEDDRTLTITWVDDVRIKSLSIGTTVYAEAIPNYQTDIDNLKNMFDYTTELSLTATDSTGMSFQLCSGRNDKITWISSGSYIMIGTECDVWRLPMDMTALDFSADRYSSFGAVKGLHANIGTDTIFLERGNKARLLYKDYYGLQNVELTLTCPEILEGTILNMQSKETGTPQVYFLKNKDSKRTIVCLTTDRANGVQGWAEWTFTTGNIQDIGIIEDSSRQKLVAIVSDTTNYLCYFDETEESNFADCSFVSSVLTDKTENYDSLMITNPIDVQTQDSITFGDDKRVDKVIFRAYKSGSIVVSTNESTSNKTHFKVAPDGIGDFTININGGSVKELCINVESYKDNPLTLLCMAYDMRVSN